MLNKMTIRAVLLLLAVFLGFSGPLMAQDEDHPWAASVNILTHQYNGDFGNEVFQFQSDSDFGFQIGLTRYLSSRLNLRLDFVHATLDYNHDGARDDASQLPPVLPGELNPVRKFETSSNTVRALLLFDLLEKESNYSVYALGGTGISFMNQENDESVTQIPVALGLGLNKRIAGPISWNLELSYNFLVGSENDNIEGTVATNGINGQFDGTDSDGFMVISTGLNFNLKTKKDMDGDGVADKDDLCPNVPGPKELNGCPDSDGDGVLDKDDACPTVAGLAELNGCPDSDGDGIIDSEDACPDVAGVAALNGCPDADGDGITDAEDACPNEAGPKATNGCPDADGDGIVDSEDACPNDAGPAATNGCPDRDQDGILDVNDNCPDKAGIELFDGCPTFVYYLPFDQAEIPTNISNTLDKLADYLKQNEGAEIKIEGHADNEGTTVYNKRLSMRRVQRAVKYLTDNGVTASRIQTEAFGDTKPIADNTTEEGRAKNRRVEIHIMN
jgi:outer membrane protein OmpA-like peptidoglycan-associated protein